jgi:hypothetical protein
MHPPTHTHTTPTNSYSPNILLCVCTSNTSLIYIHMHTHPQLFFFFALHSALCPFQCNTAVLIHKHTHKHTCTYRHICTLQVSDSPYTQPYSPSSKRSGTSHCSTNTHTHTHVHIHTYVLCRFLICLVLSLMPLPAHFLTFTAAVPRFQSTTTTFQQLFPLHICRQFPTRHTR